jgi:hypothetical protein
MKSLVLGIAAAALLIGGSSLAQTTQGTTGGTTSTVAPSRTYNGSTTGSGTAAGPAGTNGYGTDHNGNAAAASGNNNQAVATTSANAPTPAKGANSFTMGEAKSRIERNGFSNVSGLTKDSNGVWRGNAQKDGTSTMVWLDYKGNVGTGK